MFSTALFLSVHKTQDCVLLEKINKSGKLSQDTPILPQVVKLGHAPDKIQVWKTTKGTNSKIKQARVMIPVHCTSPLCDLSTHEIS